MTDNIDEPFRLSLTDHILFPLIHMQEVATYIGTFGIFFEELFIGLYMRNR